ncbi:hypothetical protein DPEC_G00206860 [Dallia pectoralis]|uniref:Uncharacterized protein n=1 Tax=Dallia pectoralis TaxID=75939 RepID=A0ACC2G5A4_DALPE|nr:hypothetical protein DPEC_G00206860 [Dallia pectoralis]
MTGNDTPVPGSMTFWLPAVCYTTSVSLEEGFDKQLLIGADLAVGAEAHLEEPGGMRLLARADTVAAEIFKSHLGCQIVEHENVFAVYQVKTPKSFA